MGFNSAFKGLRKHLNKHSLYALDELVMFKNVL